LINQVQKRWFISGIVVYSLDFLIFMLLFSMLGEIVISNSGSMLLSGVLAFVLNQVWVYKIKLSMFQLIKFTFSVIISLVLNSTLIVLLLGVTNTSVLITKLTASIILLPINYLLSTVLFGQKTR
jgi:putative flippase GtrA